MRVNIAEATPQQLNYLVSTCLTGGELFQCGRVAHKTTLSCIGGEYSVYFVQDSGVVGCEFDPTANWAHGGPIIQREIAKGMNLYGDGVNFGAVYYNNPSDGESAFNSLGPTALIAAMQSFVKSKLGCVVNIPDKLVLRNQMKGGRKP